MDRRLIMISNRLPVTVQEKEDGALSLTPSSGGLATGLGSFYQEFDVTWIGWPGKVPAGREAEVESRLKSDYQCQPVFLPEELVEKYYDGFSNRAIWPLFHSFQDLAKYSVAEWEAYREANRRFVDTLEGLVSPGDQVWVHDYQLFLLPGMIRERFPEVNVGFFLHIPFPQYDMFRLLPQHKEVIRSLVACDLVGFHTHDYMLAFLNCAHRILGLESRLGEMFVGDRLVRAGVFPMGIDFERFSSTSEKQEGGWWEHEIQREIAGQSLIFSVSRLDYTKGIPESLAGIEALLESRPDLSGKFMYLLVVVPSRENVDQYAALKSQIDETVGRINARFGNLGWAPIRYIYRSLRFEELVALYKSSQVAFVTPLRDGMNLIAKEYVACRNDEHGVLILSEMAGAAKELVDALTVNPNSREDMAEALARALVMTADEQIRRMRHMRQNVSESNVRRWAETFVRRLNDSAEATARLRNAWVDDLKKADIVSRYTAASERLIILDYDGTLIPFTADPDGAKPDAPLKQLLQKIAMDGKNRLVILSGRGRHTLGTWLEGLPATLVAEHGAWIRPDTGGEWIRANESVQVRWKKEVRPILERFVENIPGSLIEEKDYSLVWHYRKADPQSSDIASKDLVQLLLSTIGNQRIQILPGKKTVEIRSQGLGKGIFFTHTFSGEDFPFILGIGDDYTDEELFVALPEHAISIKVGQGLSQAALRVRDFRETRRLLEGLPVESSRRAAAGQAGPRRKLRLAR